MKAEHCLAFYILPEWLDARTGAFTFLPSKGRVIREGNVPRIAESLIRFFLGVASMMASCRDCVMESSCSHQRAFLERVPCVDRQLTACWRLFVFFPCAHRTAKVLIRDLLMANRAPRRTGNRKFKDSRKRPRVGDQAQDVKSVSAGAPAYIPNFEHEQDRIWDSDILTTKLRLYLPKVVVAATRTPPSDEKKAPFEEDNCGLLPMEDECSYAANLDAFQALTVDRCVRLSAVNCPDEFRNPRNYIDRGRVVFPASKYVLQFPLRPGIHERFFRYLCPVALGETDNDTATLDAFVANNPVLANNQVPEEARQELMKMYATPIYGITEIIRTWKNLVVLVQETKNKTYLDFCVDDLTFAAVGAADDLVRRWEGKLLQVTHKLLQTKRNETAKLERERDAIHADLAHATHAANNQRFALYKKDRRRILCSAIRWFRAVVFNPNGSHARIDTALIEVATELFSESFFFPTKRVYHNLSPSVESAPHFFSGIHHFFKTFSAHLPFYLGWITLLAASYPVDYNCDLPPDNRSATLLCAFMLMIGVPGSTKSFILEKLKEIAIAGVMVFVMYNSGCVELLNQDRRHEFIGKDECPQSYTREGSQKRKGETDNTKSLKTSGKSTGFRVKKDEITGELKSEQFDFLHSSSEVTCSNKGVEELDPAIVDRALIAPAPTKNDFISSRQGKRSVSTNFTEEIRAFSYTSKRVHALVFMVGMLIEHRILTHPSLHMIRFVYDCILCHPLAKLMRIPAGRNYEKILCWARTMVIESAVNKHFGRPRSVSEELGKDPTPATNMEQLLDIQPYLYATPALSFFVFGLFEFMFTNAMHDKVVDAVRRRLLGVECDDDFLPLTEQLDRATMEFTTAIMNLHTSLPSDTRVFRKKHRDIKCDVLMTPGQVKMVSDIASSGYDRQTTRMTMAYQTCIQVQKYLGKHVPNIFASEYEAQDALSEISTGRLLFPRNTRKAWHFAVRKLSNSLHRLTKVWKKITTRDFVASQIPPSDKRHRHTDHPFFLQMKGARPAAAPFPRTADQLPRHLRRATREVLQQPNGAPDANEFDPTVLVVEGIPAKSKSPVWDLTHKLSERKEEDKDFRSTLFEMERHTLVKWSHDMRNDIRVELKERIFGKRENLFRNVLIEIARAVMPKGRKLTILFAPKEGMPSHLCAVDIEGEHDPQQNQSAEEVDRKRGHDKRDGGEHKRTHNDSGERNQTHNNSGDHHARNHSDSGESKHEPRDDSTPMADRKQGNDNNSERGVAMTDDDEDEGLNDRSAVDDEGAVADDGWNLGGSIHFHLSMVKNFFGASREASDAIARRHGIRPEQLRSKLPSVSQRSFGFRIPNYFRHKHLEVSKWSDAEAREVGCLPEHEMHDLWNRASHAEYKCDKEAERKVDAEIELKRTEKAEYEHDGDLKTVVVLRKEIAELLAQRRVAIPMRKYVGDALEAYATDVHQRIGDNAFSSTQKMAMGY